MAQYYGVERSSEYLSHYGVKGMRWGIVNSFSKHYKKIKRKLNNKNAAKELKYALKSAALSTVMGPAANMYVNSKRSANNDWPEKTTKKKRIKIPYVTVDGRRSKTRAAAGATGSRIKFHDSEDAMREYAKSVGFHKRRRNA